MFFQLISKVKTNSQFSYKSLDKKPSINSLHKIYSAVITIAIALIIITIRQTGGLQILELWAYDRFVRLNSHNRQNKRLLLVEITDRDIKNQDRWPLSDATLAQLIDKLQQHEPTAIGLDIYRDIAYPPGRSSLIQQLQKDNVISIQYLGSDDNQVAAPAEVKSEQIGFNDVVLDTDSRLRRNLMYARLGEEELYSFALRLSLFYLNNNPTTAGGDFELTVDDDYLYIGDASLKRLLANSGGYRMQPSEASGWQTLLKYQSPDIVPRVSLTEVLEGNIDPNLVKDKVVIIGTTASSINDFFFTPYGGTKTDMPGAIAHAQMVSQIISLALEEATQFWFFGEGIELLWIGMWSIAGMAIAIKIENPLKIAAVGLSGIIFIGGICWLFFIVGGWIPLIPAVLGFSLTVCSLLLQRVFYSYFYDSLTRLPNKTLFIKQLQKLKQQARKLEAGSIMVLCIDLDRFKMINDALGDRAGDRLLMTTACRLRAILEGNGILARVGGDEFAIAQIVSNEDEALKIVRSLQTELNVPFDLKGLKTATTVTTGIVVSKIAADFDAANTLSSARTAMDRAKASGKTNHLFAITIRDRALKRLQLEADLYEAIKKEEFELYYQPIINLTTEKIAGFEALIRWNSPHRGFVSPGAFIPIAEEIGAIIPLGEWVLKEACSQMNRWQKQFSTAKSLFISVNLSGKQFIQPNTEIIALLDTAIANAEKLNHLPAASYGWGLQGRVREILSQWDAASQSTVKALQIAQTLNAPEIAYLWQWQLGRIDRVKGNKKEAISHYQQGITLLNTLSQDLAHIDSNIQYSFRDSVEPVYRETVALLLDVPSGETVSQDNLIQARDIIESLQIVQLNNFFRQACLRGKSVSIDAVDTHAAALYPIVLSDRLELILSLPNRPLTHYSVAIPQAELEATVEQLRKTVVIRSRRTYYEPATKLYNWLITPILEELTQQQIKTLVFIPDGVLHNVPLAALYDGKNYLIEQYNLVLNPGLQLLAPRPLTETKLKTLAVGLTQERGNFSALEYVNLELAQIQQQVKSEILVDEQFTTEALREEIKFSDYPIVHIATHGQFSSSIENTFLLAWNDRINIEQLKQILQSKTGTNDAIELLVLSACETASGDDRAALGLAGMAIQAGAKSTIATLWSINDRATAQLMETLYRAIALQSLGKAQAVRQAQLRLLHDPKYEHPFYWAAYTTIGNWL